MPMAEFEDVFVMDDRENPEVPLAQLIAKLQTILESVPEADRQYLVAAVGSPGGDSMLTVEWRSEVTS